jgi:hypothetical protein
MIEFNAPVNTPVPCPACACRVHINCYRAVGVRCGCIACRVAAGVRFLDSYRAGIGTWRTRIDAGRLTMASLKDDVLGQLWGDYGFALSALSLTDEQAMALGFRAYAEDYDDPEWGQLTGAWLAVLAVERSALGEVA